MKISRIYLLLCVNYVATIVTCYRKCYDSLSLCLITNTDDGSKFRLRSSADNWCKVQSSTLAIIANETVQSAIVEFFNDYSAELVSDVITDCYRINLPSWEWINRRQSVLQPGASYETHRYAYLIVSSDRASVSFYGQATSKKNCICSHYLNNSSTCSDGYQRIGMTCYKMHHKEVTWFEARNLCFQEEGSELAIFEYGFPTLTSESGDNEEYWIGLRKERWACWNGQRYDADLRYSTWDDGNPSFAGGNCLCLKARTGKWTECDCSKKYRYICIQGSTSTVKTSTTKRKTTQSTTTAILTVGDSSPQFHSTSTHTLDDDYRSKVSDNPPDTVDTWKSSGMLIGLGIGSACLLILIIVIAVVVFIKIRRRGSGDVGPRHGDFSPPAMHKDSHPPTTHNDDAPSTVYAVVIPDDNKPARSPSEKTSNQTVYADLDLEPKRKVAKRASEPVRGPSVKTSIEVFYEDLDLAPKGNTLGRDVPESEYANSSLVDSVYANSAQTKV